MMVNNNTNNMATIRLGVRQLNLATSYTGFIYDQVLNIYFAQARMYDPSIRRFMAVDPVRGNIFNPQLMVAYTFVLNNPLRWVDPLGLSPHIVDLEDFVESAGGSINWGAGTITVGTETRDMNFNHWDENFQGGGGIGVNIDGLDWMLGSMDNSWMDDLCDYQFGNILSDMLGADSAIGMLRVMLNARSMHADVVAAHADRQRELFGDAWELARGGSWSSANVSSVQRPNNPGIGFMSHGMPFVDDGGTGNVSPGRVWFVHGTWGSADDHWPQDFMNHVRAELGYPTAPTNWGGALAIPARMQGARGLAVDIAVWYGRNPGGDIMLVGYSHGGNVAIRAINYLATPCVVGDHANIVNTLITIGTPVRIDYQIISSRTSVERHINVYNTEDSTQLMGSWPSFIYRYGDGRRFTENAGVLNIQVQVPEGISGTDAHRYMHDNPRVWERYVFPALRSPIFNAHFAI